jgi:hypothetical protein
VIYSDDGSNWHLGGIVGLNSSDECSIAQLGNGTIVMNIRNYIDQRTGKIQHSSSGGIVRAFADSTDEVSLNSIVNNTFSCMSMFGH